MSGVVDSVRAEVILHIMGGAPAPELAAITLGVARAVKPAPVSTGNTSGRHVLRRSARAGPAIMAP